MASLPVAAVHDPADLRRPRALPGSLLEASADLGARPGRRSDGWCCRSSFLSVVAGSIFTFSLTLGDYIVPDLVSDAKFIGNVIYDNSALGDFPVAAAYSIAADRHHHRLPGPRPAARGVRVPVMAAIVTESRWVRIGLRSSTWVILAFLYLPLILVGHLRLQRERLHGLAAAGLLAALVRRGARQPGHPPGVRQLDRGRARCGRDRARARHAGRDGRAALLILRPRVDQLPARAAIALPGVLTGIALSSTFQTIGVGSG